jgi:hypothetical protein
MGYGPRCVVERKNNPRGACFDKPASWYVNDKKAVRRARRIPKNVDGFAIR